MTHQSIVIQPDILTQPLCIQEEGGLLTRIFLSGETPEFDSSPATLEAASQIKAYFEGELTRFDLPYQVKGSPFYQQVWEYLPTIAYGKTASYGEVAKALKNDKATRAVGSANRCNPLPILLPCHRVTAKNKAHGGNYSLGGIKTQLKLLALEQNGTL